MILERIVKENIPKLPDQVRITLTANPAHNPLANGGGQAPYPQHSIQQHFVYKTINNFLLQFLKAKKKHLTG